MRKRATVNMRYTEAIKIDWDCALKEAQNMLNKSFSLQWEEKIKKAEIAVELIHQCNNADISGYLDIIEKYRSEIKNVPATIY